MTPSPLIEEMDPDSLPSVLEGLADVLYRCVLAGASVGFVLPFSREDAAGFWRGLLPAFRSGARRLLVARWGGRVVGTVQVLLDTPPNGRHRAEIAKMLVHPDMRRRGLARALLVRAEDVARRHGRGLLVLDTVPGGASEALYRELGFQTTGMVPGYARSTRGVLEDSLFMHKVLSG